MAGSDAFRKLGYLAAGCAAISSFMLLPASVSAHEISTAGPYRIAIGWQFEPAGGSVTWVGQPNAVQIFVDQTAAGNNIGTPVGDLNADCGHPDIQVTITYENITSSPLCPQPAYDSDTGRGRQDEYDAAITPTKVGDYTFHLFGTIHGTKVDHTVKSGPDTFDGVGDQNAVEFPSAAPALGDVATKVDALGARANSALSTAQSASDAGNRGTIIALVALAAALLLGGSALILSRRRSTS